MTKKKIKNILKNRLFRKKIKGLEKEILSLVPFAETLEEALFCIKNDIEEKPVCQYQNCNNKIPHRYYLSQGGLGSYSIGCCENHTKKLNNLKKYGVENISQLDYVKKKKEQTTLRKYGVKNPKQNKEIADRIKNTMESKYGGFGRKGILRQKIESTCLKKYGNVNPMKTSFSKGKLVRTLFDKIVERLKNNAIPNFTFEEYLGSEAKQKWICVHCHEIFEGKIDNGSVPKCPICYPSQNGISFVECEIFEKINHSNKIQSDRIVLNGKELDIYIPDEKLAIEVNGVYWHSEEKGKDKDYHLNKTKQCEKKGIQLIHIFDTEWYFKQEIIKSFINAKLNNFQNVIHENDCKIKEIGLDEKKWFLENNHLKGNDDSTIRLGLYYCNELVSVMTFNNYNKKNQYEISRFCFKLGHQIINGIEKMWLYFIDNYNPSFVIVEENRRYPVGSIYEQLGFVKSRETKPVLLSIENNKIWDCGNIEYIWTK